MAIVSTMPQAEKEDALSKDFSISAVTAGFLAVVVSYAGPLLIFFQAARVGHVPSDIVTSWIWAISIGTAVSGIALSWWFKAPVITAWSAPGSALLLTLLPHISLGEVAGAYLLAAFILLAIGLSGGFDWLVRKIPRAIASAMMAGILFQFGASAFRSAPDAPVLAFGMIFAYLLLKRLLPRYSLVLLLLFGLALAIGFEGSRLDGVRVALATPVFIAPEWTWKATLSLALPLVLVSLTGQFLPGMAILRTAGYDTPARPIIVGTSLASIIVAPFGGITIATAAITAALCTGEQAHPDRARRYIAGLASGAFFLVGGLFAGTIVQLFSALPGTFISVLAGLALIGAISNSIADAVEPTIDREAAIITFLATASGMSFLGLGSAFWGIVIGGLAHCLLHMRGRRDRHAHGEPSRNPESVASAHH